MAPPKLLRKADGSRKKTSSGLRAQVGAIYQLTPAEYQKYLRESPETLQRAISAGVFLPPDGVSSPAVPRSSAPSASVVPAGARPIDGEPARDTERLNERQRARQSLNNILRENPELLSPNSVMLPNGKVIQRPVPDIDVDEARQRVASQMTGGRPATEYERALAFGDILTRRAQESAQQELQNFLTESLINTNAIPNNISQNVLRRAAGVSNTERNISIKRGGDGGSGAPRPPEGSRPAEGPRPPEGSRPAEGPRPPAPSGKISTSKITDTQREVFASAGTTTKDVTTARDQANRNPNPKAEFRRLLSEMGINNAEITNIINSFES